MSIDDMALAFVYAFKGNSLRAHYYQRGSDLSALVTWLRKNGWEVHWRPAK